MSWLHLYAAVQLLVTQDSHSGPRVPAGARPSLRPLGFEGEAIKQSSGEMRREDDKPCLSNKGLVPRTLRSASSAVRCRAGAHVAARVVALWVPALRSNAYALQRVRDTGGTSAAEARYRYRVISALNCP